MQQILVVRNVASSTSSRKGGNRSGVLVLVCLDLGYLALPGVKLGRACICVCVCVCLCHVLGHVLWTRALVLCLCVCLCLSCVGPCALDKGPGASTRALVPHSYNGSGVSTAAKLARPVFTHGFFSAWCC